MRRAGGTALIEEWPAETFERELRARDRMIVLFHASWCPYSRLFLPEFERAEPDANVPLAKTDLAHPMDPRWDEFRILVVPTLVYFEHGEELERMEAVRHKGLTRRDMEEFLDSVDAIQDEPVLPKRMHGPRRR